MEYVPPIRPAVADKLAWAREIVAQLGIHRWCEGQGNHNNQKGRSEHGQRTGVIIASLARDPSIETASLV